jgi:hypothetical protein
VTETKQMSEKKNETQSDADQRNVRKPSTFHKLKGEGGEKVKN